MTQLNKSSNDHNMFQETRWNYFQEEEGGNHYKRLNKLRLNILNDLQCMTSRQIGINVYFSCTWVKVHQNV